MSKKTTINLKFALPNYNIQTIIMVLLGLVATLLFGITIYQKHKINTLLLDNELNKITISVQQATQQTQLQMIKTYEQYQFSMQNNNTPIISKESFCKLV